MHDYKMHSIALATQVFSVVFFWIPPIIASVWLSYRIIKKTGYPGGWAWIAFAPALVVFVGVIVSTIVLAFSPPVGGVTLLFAILFVLLIILSFVMYLVFAYSNWPILQRLELAKAALQAQASRPTGQPEGPSTQP